MASTVIQRPVSFRSVTPLTIQELNGCRRRIIYSGKRQNKGRSISFRNTSAQFMNIIIIQDAYFAHGSLHPNCFPSLRGNSHLDFRSNDEFPWQKHNRTRKLSMCQQP